jgi:hypothetical protein
LRSSWIPEGCELPRSSDGCSIEFDGSGMSVGLFARRAALSYSTFAAWFSDIGDKTACTQIISPFVGGSRGTGSTRSGVAGVPGGARMELHALGQVALAAALVRALEKPCSFSGRLTVFVAVDPCEMRKGFNGLLAVV